MAEWKAALEIYENHELAANLGALQIMMQLQREMTAALADGILKAECRVGNEFQPVPTSLWIDEGAAFPRFLEGQMNLNQPAFNCGQHSKRLPWGLGRKRCYRAIRGFLYPIQPQCIDRQDWGSRSGCVVYPSQIRSITGGPNSKAFESELRSIVRLSQTTERILKTNYMHWLQIYRRMKWIASATACWGMLQTVQERFGRRGVLQTVQEGLDGIRTRSDVNRGGVIDSAT